MKLLLSVGLLISCTILCGMNEEFQRALDANTTYAIIAWQQKYTANLNSKCLRYYSKDGDCREAYPLTAAVRTCLGKPTALRARLKILKSVGVSVDGYDDYNPLCDFISLSMSQEEYLDLIPELLAFGADPNKRAKCPLHAQPISAFDLVNTLIGKEAAKPKITDALRRYQKIQTWLLTPPDIETHPDNITVAAQQPVPPVKRTISSRTDPIVGVSDSDDDRDDDHQPVNQFFVYRYVAMAAAVCGCVLVGKFIYDWCFQSDDTATEKSEPESRG